jgi:class 3 adenylate cyclase
MAMAEERVERRLAAIFAGDVAGYSRLMGIDEEGTLAALKRASARARRPQDQGAPRPYR